MPTYVLSSVVFVFLAVVIHQKFDSSLVAQCWQNGVFCKPLELQISLSGFHVSMTFPVKTRPGRPSGLLPDGCCFSAPLSCLECTRRQ